MKTELKAKYIQFLNQKKQDEGFTLIELLVVIIIIGILAAIALPSFLNQANKAKQSEAKTYVGSMNRAQQAFYLENDYFTAFDTAEGAGKGMAELGLGVATETANYKYTIKGGATKKGDASADKVTNQAQPIGDKSSLKAYIGGVNIGTVTGTGEATSLAVLCEAKKAVVNGGDKGVLDADFAEDKAPVCPPATYKPVGGAPASAN